MSSSSGIHTTTDAAANCGRPAAVSPDRRPRRPHRRRPTPQRCRRVPPDGPPRRGLLVRAVSIAASPARSESITAAKAAPPTRAAPLNPSPRPIGIDERTHSGRLWSTSPLERGEPLGDWVMPIDQLGARWRFARTDIESTDRAPARAHRIRRRDWPMTPALERRTSSLTRRAPARHAPARRELAWARPSSIAAPATSSPAAMSATAPPTTSPAAALRRTMSRCGSQLTVEHAA